MSHPQDGPVTENNSAVKTLDGTELPVFFKKFPTYGPKYSIEAYFNESHLLAGTRKLSISMQKVVFEKKPSRWKGICQLVR